MQELCHRTTRTKQPLFKEIILPLSDIVKIIFTHSSPISVSHKQLALEQEYLAQHLHILRCANKSCRIYFKHLPYNNVQILYASISWQEIAANVSWHGSISWRIMFGHYCLKIVQPQNVGTYNWHKVCRHDSYNILLVSYMQDLCQLGACKNDANPPRPYWDYIIIYIPHNKNFSLQ